MKRWHCSFLLIPLLPLLVCASPKAREETVFLFENRKLTIAVPEGFGSVTEKDGNGLVSVKLADTSDRVTGELRFLPDPEGRFATARARAELMSEMFVDYVESSSERGMQFEELEPQSGEGTYCVFTDTKLVGKTKLPPGEYLHLTTGVKSWPGVVAVFRIFSQDTNSAPYQAVLKMLRESVEERGVPLK